MRIVCISDTHGLHRQVAVPPGDILIHAGDLTRHGGLDELPDLNDWLGALPHPHKLLIAGNHDWCFEREPAEAAALLTNATYLCDAAVTIGGLCFYGSPWVPALGWAFSRGALPLQYHWSQLPAGIDVLLTHGPPLGALDQNPKGEHLGDAALAEAVLRVKPKLHVFGHIHEAYGRLKHQGTSFINASTCTYRYEPTHPPVIVDLS